MADRQALRELQSRLAQRLQQARTQASAAAWLAVQAGGRRYLLPLTQSGEIFPYAATQPVPYTKPWFLGVANLRGGLYGVVELQVFSGESQSVARTEVAKHSARMIAFNAALGINCVVVVDRLLGLRNEQSFTSLEALEADRADCLTQKFSDAEGVDWYELDLQKLAENAGFLGIGSA
jgi:twitching motility protein PilI